MKKLKLKTVRTAMDMSQQQLADAVGVTRQTIGMIKAGKYNPLSIFAYQYARFWAKHLTIFSGKRKKMPKKNFISKMI